MLVAVAKASPMRLFTWMPRFGFSLISSAVLNYLVCTDHCLSEYGSEILMLE